MTSKPCPAAGCGRTVPADEIACKPHRYKVTVDTRQKLKAARTPDQYNTAWAACLDEMNRSTTTPKGTTQ